MRLISKSLLPMLLAVSVSPLAAQDALVGGLESPTRLFMTPRGNLLVTEAGDGVNTGALSLVDRTASERRILVAGLPSALASPGGGEPEPTGPSGVTMSGSTIYITTGEGDSVLPGGPPGTSIPNPDPESVLNNAILSFDFSAPVDSVEGGLVLDEDDMAHLDAGQAVTLGEGTNRVTIRVVADLPDFVSEPREDFPANVRPSNLYGIAAVGEFLFVADASGNTILKVNAASGATTILTSFPDIPNPTGIGGPTAEAVPDSIRADGEHLLVTLLTGFPFIEGASSLVEVDPESGDVTPLITGLSSAIDVAPIHTPAGTSYLISEFSTDLLNDTNGRVVLHGASNSPLQVMGPIRGPSSVVVDQKTGEVFVTQLFGGRVIRQFAQSTIPLAQPASIIPIAGSIPGILGSRFETSMQLANPNSFPISGTLLLHTGSSTVAYTYALQPFETRTFTNFLAAAGLSGIVTIDVAPGVGPAPVALTRIFDTSRSSASTGAVIAQVPRGEALHAGESAVLVAAADAAHSRTNLGIRALAGGATIQATLYDHEGHEIETVERTYDPNQLEHVNLSQFFGADLHGSDMVILNVTAGSAIGYVAINNNETQETNWVLARRIQ